MSEYKYSVNSTLKDILESEKARNFFEQAAPGMLDSPVMQFMNPATISQLMENSPDKKQLFEAMLDLANGKDITFELEDPHKTKPRIVEDNAEYNVDDVDGKMYMLEHRFSGCLVVRFTKEMNENIYGQVTYQNEALPQGLIKKIDAAGGMQMFGIPVRHICTEYDKDYEFKVEGFADVDGNYMEPQLITVHTTARPDIDIAYAEHDAVALEAAREGIVLLKNENQTLPISPTSSLSVYGMNQFRLGAVGAGKINPRYYLDFKRAVNECSQFTISEDSDTGIFIISRASGENYDNNALSGEYYLTAEEENALKEMKEQCQNVVAVINSGYPMDLRWLEKYEVPAAVWCGYPGMCGGRALVEILDGRVCPSGKLPDTWSLDYYDIPSSRNFYLPKEGEEALSADAPVYVDTFYEEDIYVGYRYFETFQKAVAYPFGHGLSYTKFVVSEASVETDENENGMTKGWTVRVQVSNAGNTGGKEVVQIYASIPEKELEQPEKRLIGFAKTRHLEPGESGQLEITIPIMNLASFHTGKASWLLEEGCYRFYVGTDIHHVKESYRWELKEELFVKRSENLMKLPVEMELLSKKNSDLPTGQRSGLKENNNDLAVKSERKKYPADIREVSLAKDYSVEELARLSICASHGWGVHETGEAGRIYRLEGRDLPRYAVADGNNGVNVNKPNIGMPCSNTVCATWNTELAYEVGRVIGEEAKENEIQMILAPAMNIHRNPLNGRHPEYFSEDPLLGGTMAGYQCKGLEETGVDGCMKHVIANNCETSRKRNHSFISERALREIYLKVFEVAMGVHKPASIMTSYNACNGSYTAEDEELIQGIFVEEFGLEGFVMTDWNSYDTINIPAAIQAGNCWMTPGSADDTYVKPVIEGVRTGKISEQRLRSNVEKMLYVILKEER